MSTILRRIEELFRLKRPDQPAMTKMTGMEQRERESSSMAALAGDMEMARMQPEERQAVSDTGMQPAAAMPGSSMGPSMMEHPMMEDPMPASEANMQIGKGKKENM